MAKLMDLKRIEFYADLIDVVERELKEFDLPGDTARAIANALADHLADEWRGQHILFPRDHRRVLLSRDLAIYQEFNGRNCSQLARKYHLSERAMYKLIKRMRAMFVARVQVDLFQPPEQS